MTNRKKRLKRQKRIRGAIRATFCALTLVIIVSFIQILTNATVKSLPPSTAENTTDKLPSTSEDTKKKNDTSADDKKLTVCIDAGHGGKDNGADNGTRMEKDDTLKLALAVADYLKDFDINIVLTRSDDTYLTLSQRCTVANNASADYFVSLHRNKGDGAGVETWIYSDADSKTIELSENIMSGLDSVGIQRNRGVKKGTQNSSSKNYYINSHSDMPACIIEMGFINNSTDNTLFDDNQTDYAKAIGDAILKTYNANQPDTPNTNAPDNDAGANDNAAASTSHSLSNPQIDNVAALDSTNKDWGPGSDTDEQNRPLSSLSYQEKYGQYSTYFIVPDSDKIYLTFDEGYENGCTPAILDTLKEKNVSAVFFVTSQFAKDEPELIQRIIDEGHMLGSHSVSHPANGLPSQSIEEQQHEVMGLHEYIQENFNYEMHLFRFPAGKFSDQSLAIVNNCNYKSVFWSFAYLDYDVNNQPDQAEALNKLNSKLHPGAIYLLHAVSPTNTAILGSFIDQTRAAGYEFALLD